MWTRDSFNLVHCLFVKVRLCVLDADAHADAHSDAQSDAQSDADERSHVPKFPPSDNNDKVPRSFNFKLRNSEPPPPLMETPIDSTAADGNQYQNI